jgi:hypothetical protein
MARAVPSGKPGEREISAPRSHRILTKSRPSFCPRNSAEKNRPTLVRNGLPLPTLRTRYDTASGSRSQSTIFKALFASESSASRRAATLEALLEHPASFNSRA